MTVEPVVCERCGREIEDCYLCETAECAAAVCHRCVGTALNEMAATPHPHGG